MIELKNRLKQMKDVKGHFKIYKVMNTQEDLKERNSKETCRPFIIKELVDITTFMK